MPAVRCGFCFIQRKKEMKKVRKHFYFYGNVQGVGFRSRARWMASSLDLTGWVKNEWDGSVEMEVQGDPAAIAKLLEQLNHMSYAWIDRMSSVDMEVIGESGFHVR